MIPKERILQSRLLIIDDQEANVLLLEKILQGNGYKNTLSTTDPKLSLDLYKSFQPDLVLLDLHMPEMDGFEVMKQITEEEGDIDYAPILVLTADVTHPAKIRALQSGAKDFLTKPFDTLEVVTRIRNILEVRMLYKDLRSQNEILEEKVRERTRELRETRLEIIHRLGRAAEYRDQGTGLHLLRISQFSGCLAKSIGLPVYQCDMILSASPMHDIGKIGIPDRILLKPGKLDPDEWEIMRKHPTIGAELLAGHESSLMQAAAQIALTHHEKWDGSGYPNSLKREDIPLEGRIVALCDVFDALLSERPYKKSWKWEDAVREIDGCSGEAFDPYLVEKFHRALPDMKEILDKIDTRMPQGQTHDLG